MLACNKTQAIPHYYGHALRYSRAQRPYRQSSLEYTPDYFGTIADCDSDAIHCGIFKKSWSGESRPGFFAKQNAGKFTWQRHHIDGTLTKEGQLLSVAMAQSSGILTTPAGLSWSMELVQGEQHRLLSFGTIIYCQTEGSQIILG